MHKWPFFEGVGRVLKICVHARVYVACAYNLTHIGESCTGDRGSSELVSPLKAFLLLVQALSSSPQNFEGGQWHAAPRRQKCESLILNNRSTMQRMRFYGKLLRSIFGRCCFGQF